MRSFIRDYPVSEIKNRKRSKVRNRSRSKLPSFQKAGTKAGELRTLSSHPLRVPDAVCACATFVKVCRSAPSSTVKPTGSTGEQQHNANSVSQNSLPASSALCRIAQQPDAQLN
ncbi:hypothetical protein CEXT_211151 [Caerostris extrusa]|uniref:Uncharacterized protein n=1 Tax=Caerostris extrusa TaxID=172846 RepID=A0AAV4XYM7_CAEEX|nr:hypothetical protein CEXT_211151 [Caerostris extrusa]